MTEILEKLKYKDEIKNLMEKGIELPDLREPQKINTFRYAFREPNSKNHLPIYKQSPQRLIQERNGRKIKTSGFALSCYDNEEKAESAYRKYTDSNKNFPKLVGDYMSKGVLLIESGRITTVNKKSRHFDLYEFRDFIASSCFNITKKLV